MVLTIMYERAKFIQTSPGARVQRRGRGRRDGAAGTERYSNCEHFILTLAKIFARSHALIGMGNKDNVSIIISEICIYFFFFMQCTYSHVYSVWRRFMNSVVPILS